MPAEGLPSWPVEWPAPAGVKAFMSMRQGGVSRGPYSSLNLGLHVGDNAQDVGENRQRLERHLQARPLWLNQVHGAAVAEAETVAAGTSGPADALCSFTSGQACAVLVADCLPVLFCSADGRAVAAAHAGWRGLAAGVLEATVQQLVVRTPCAVTELHAWLGPCIGPAQFEVGSDVQQAFGAQGAARFKPHVRANGSAAWLCDLAGLAEDRLYSIGLRSIHGRTACTVEHSSNFFSFRRDGVTGRMAAVIMIET
jgi:polyphenol oxidase